MNAKDRKHFEEAQTWPIGTPVIYTRDSGERVETSTTSIPWLWESTAGSLPVIDLDGMSLPRLLSRIEKK